MGLFCLVLAAALVAAATSVSQDSTPPIDGARTPSAGPSSAKGPIVPPSPSTLPSTALRDRETRASTSVVPPDALAKGLGGQPAGRRHAAMESSLRPMLAQPLLRAGVFGVDLGNEAYFDLSGGESFPAASLIKVPIAAALLTEVDAGTIALDSTLALEATQIAGGSGHLQYMPVGTRFTVQRLAELMIRKSDNTATNMLIDRLGGMARLNDVFSGWGLTRTHLQSLLPDMNGTNRTCPHDLVSILRASVSGGLLRPASRDLLLSWMRRTHVRSLLPAGVGVGSRVANKTGDIPGALGDAGYVEAPDGRRYLLAVQVERPRNSVRAKALIRSVSRTVFESLTGSRVLGPRSTIQHAPLRHGPLRSALGRRNAS